MNACTSEVRQVWRGARAFASSQRWVIRSEHSLVALSVCTLAAMVGCATRDPLPVNAGRSEWRPELAEPTKAASTTSNAWPRVGEVAAYAMVSKSPFLSHGHFEGRWKAELSANQHAEQPYRAFPKRSLFPTGSVVVQKLQDAKTQSPGPWFAMEKREQGYYSEGGDWSYVVVNAQGQVDQEGRLSLCARCHAEAPIDRLFGLPADAP